MANEPITLIVCRDARHAKFISRQITNQSRLKVCWPALMQIHGFAPRTIIIMPGVDLTQNVEGEGSLLRLLLARQATWGDASDFIEL